MAAEAPAPPQRDVDAPFWTKYSQHHEMPISGLTSLAWHILAAVLIVALAFVISRRDDADMPIESVTIGGGGGSPQGVGPGRGDAGALVEAATPRDLPSDAVLPKDPLVDITDLKISAADLLKDMNLDKNAEREIAKIAERGTQALNKLAKLDKKTATDLLGQGKGGPGSGGGSGTGDGAGTGGGEGPTTGNIRGPQAALDDHVQHRVRLRLLVRQLDTLGAILAVKHPTAN